MEQVVVLGLQAAGIFLALLTYFWRLERSREKKFDRVFKTLNRLEENSAGSLKEFETRRREDMRNVYQRIENVERSIAEMKAKEEGKFGEITGELKGIKNVLDLLHRRELNEQ